MAQTKEYFAEYYQKNKEKVKAKTGAYSKTKRGKQVHKKSRAKHYQSVHGRAVVLRHAANQRDECSLSVEWVEQRILAGCALSGLPFDLSVPKQQSPYAPSIDKINPTEGYTEANSRLILWSLNAFKGSNTDADMLRIASALLTKQAGGV